MGSIGNVFKKKERKKSVQEVYRAKDQGG